MTDEEVTRIARAIAVVVWGADVANVQTWTQAILAAIEEYDRIQVEHRTETSG